LENQPTSGLIYGIFPVLEFLRAGGGAEKILMKKGLSGHNVQEIRKLAGERGTPIKEVPAEKLDRTVRGNHQGVICYGSLVTWQNAEDVVPFIFEGGTDPLILVLDRVTDVRNFGALCRTAECAGFHAVLVPSRGAAEVNADAVKSSAGAVFRLNLCRSNNLKKTLSFLAESGIRLAGITEKAENDLFHTDFSGPLALILGSEEDGISPEYIKLCHVTAKIPMPGATESLNVSAAGAVAMYEVVRQRISST
jgi:23S rRNA (guanosine2251-2'-O)-methyltransferase